MKQGQNFAKVMIAKNAESAFEQLHKEDDIFKRKEILMGHCEMKFRKYKFENERLAMQYIESDSYGRFNIASLIDLGELQFPHGMKKFIFYGKVE